MARYYLGCMPEQYGPRELLEQAVAGERAGFDWIACSDHFQPWWEPGESGQAPVWLGAAARAPGGRAGLGGIAGSDHFRPWWGPGESGQAWVWLGAAAQATERVPVGPAVT